MVRASPTPRCQRDDVIMDALLARAPCPHRSSPMSCDRFRTALEPPWNRRSSAKEGFTCVRAPVSRSEIEIARAIHRWRCHQQHSAHTIQMCGVTSAFQIPSGGTSGPAHRACTCGDNVRIPERARTTIHQHVKFRAKHCTSAELLCPSCFGYAPSKTAPRGGTAGLREDPTPLRLQILLSKSPNAAGLNRALSDRLGGRGIKTRCDVALCPPMRSG